MANTKQDMAATARSLYEMAVGHYFSRAIYLAAKLGVADQLKDGPRDCVQPWPRQARRTRLRSLA